MKLTQEIYGGIAQKADQDGQFAIAWALCQHTIEVKELKRGLIGDFSGPGVLSDPSRLERASLAIESVASAISEISAEMRGG